MLGSRFRVLNEAWRTWAATADRSEEGWQSGFPEWYALIEEAARAMTRQDIDPSELSLLAECWVASEEDEELLERTQCQVDDCWRMMEALAASAPPACRWQLYQLASAGDSRADVFLRHGLRDMDGYARRRAVLALAPRKPHDARILAETFMIDPDPYMRQAAIEMILVSGDEAFKTQALRTLMEDTAENVRSAARHYMSPP